MTIREIPACASPHRAQRRLSADIRLAQILDAAQMEFSVRGYALTRMEDIASRCGLSKGSLYRHFHSKESLFEALLFKSIRLYDLATLGTKPSSGDRLALLEAILHEIYDSLAKPDTLAAIRLLLINADRAPTAVKHWYQTFTQPISDLLSRSRHDHSTAAQKGSHKLINSYPWLAITPFTHAVVAHILLEDRARTNIEQYRQSHIALIRTLLLAPI